MIKPNLRELGDVTGQKLSDDASIVTAATTLREALGVAAMVVSRGAAGISVIDAAGPVHVPAVAREVFDEAGAGDTVVAVLALGIAAGLELATSARLANAAAGVVVAKRGTAQVTPSELIEALTGRERTSAAARSAGTVVERDLIRQVVESWRFDGYRVGFTNGCFDILHPGHVALLEAARATCDRLVVGLNSDASVGRLKGPERPINDQDARAHVLAAVGAVDAVVIFDEDTPSELIEALMPDVLVKGADYTIEQVVGARFVLAYGGRVELVPLVLRPAAHPTSSLPFERPSPTPRTRAATQSVASEPPLDRWRAWTVRQALPLWTGRGFAAQMRLFEEALTFSGEPVETVPLRLMVQCRQIAVLCLAERHGWMQGAADHAAAAGRVVAERYFEADGRPGWVFAIDRSGRPARTERDLYAHAFALFALAHLTAAGEGSWCAPLIAATLRFLDAQMADPIGGGYLTCLPAAERRAAPGPAHASAGSDAVAL